MSKESFLPLLDPNVSISLPEQGHWKNNGSKIVKAISDGILIDEEARLRGVSSIPDVWARPLLFSSALRVDSAHPMRKQLIEEWRGLMSLLAFYHIGNLPVTITPVNLDNERFSKALKNLAPKNIQLEKGKSYSWTDIMLISFYGIPVGAFSPATLVYTATDYKNKLAGESSPFISSDGYLQPPKSPEGLEFIGEWILALRKRLNTDCFFSEQENPDHETVLLINDLLKDWEKEIKATLDKNELNSDKVRPGDIMIEPSKNAPFLNDYKVYQNLLLYLVKESPANQTGHPYSEISLKTTRNKTGKEIVIISEKLLTNNVKLWNMNWANLPGNNPSEYIEANFKESHGTVIDTIDINEEGGMWIRPERFFLANTLLKAKAGPILNENEKELHGNDRFLLPLRKEILDYFAPNDIKEILKPEFREENGYVRFSINLPIVNNKSLKLEKTYRSKEPQSGEGTIEETDIPILSIFPNYLGEHWHKYYLLQSDSGQFNLNFVFESEGCTTTSQQHYDAESKQNIRITELSGSNSFPEALHLVSALDTQRDFGMILLKRSETKRALSGKWTVGIDFGTSNTNIYKQVEDVDIAERWKFNFPKFIRNLTAGYTLLQDRLLQEYLIPNKEVNLPIPTTLRIFDPAFVNTPFLDYGIYFSGGTYSFPPTVISNIKWDVEERRTQQYLGMLLFFIMADAVNERVSKVEIKCSYPKAFSELNKKMFIGDWDAIYEKMLFSKESVFKIANVQESSVLIGVTVVDKVRYATEGIAAGEFFGSKKTIPVEANRAKLGIPTICMDVGGGTTDISIWLNNNIAFDASIRLAGEHISVILQKNHRLRELLFSSEAVQALEEKKNDLNGFAARLNLILTKEEKSITANLLNKANLRDIQWFRQMLALEFCAVSYYTAIICAAANIQLKGELANNIAERGIKMHWGGNASKFINWIGLGSFNDLTDKIISIPFYNCIKELGINPKMVNAVPSPSYKDEASGGLVVMPENRFDDSDNGFQSGNDLDVLSILDVSDDSYDKNSKGVVCGESIRVSEGVSIDTKDIIEDSSLFRSGRTLFNSTTLDRLEHFLNIFNRGGVRLGLFQQDAAITLSEMQKQTIKSEIMDQMIKAQSLSSDKRSIESVFIMEIKYLMVLLRENYK